MSELPHHQQAQKKKRSGSDTRRRQKVISVRCYGDEAAKIEANAAAAGFRASGFLRILGTGEQRPHEHRRPLPGEIELARLRGEAGHVDGNLAQFLRLTNRGDIPESADLKDAYRAVHDFWKRATERLFGD
jgi:hypothetical protein